MGAVVHSRLHGARFLLVGFFLLFPARTDRETLDALPVLEIRQQARIA